MIKRRIEACMLQLSFTLRDNVAFPEQGKDEGVGRDVDLVQGLAERRAELHVFLHLEHCGIKLGARRVAEQVSPVGDLIDLK
jgi:hypothetical protein